MLHTCDSWNTTRRGKTKQRLWSWSINKFLNLYEWHKELQWPPCHWSPEIPSPGQLQFEVLAFWNFLAEQAPGPSSFDLTVPNPQAAEYTDASIDKKAESRCNFRPVTIRLTKSGNDNTELFPYQFCRTVWNNFRTEENNALLESHFELRAAFSLDK